ncbi:DUF3649 domain-containing protein [Pseudomonas sp. SIMBA_077]
MVKQGKSATSLRYRLAVLSRVVAAVVGGYTLTALCTACLALSLPLTRVEAVVSATLPAFLILCLAVIWVFAARSAWLAWFGLLVPCLVLGAGYLGLSSMGLPGATS